MDKLMEYICEELEELERKADKEGKLSMAEIEYVDKLAHIKKSLLTAEELWEDSEYSEAGGGSYRGGNSYRRSYARGGQGGRGQGGGGNSYEGGQGGGRGGSSYARGRGRGRNARRDSMGRYSGESGYSYGSEDMVQELRELMEDAPDDRTKQEFERFIQKIEQM